MTCPKCNFQNPENEVVCRQCQTALPTLDSSVSPLTFDQPKPPERSRLIFIFIGGLVVIIIAIIVAGGYIFTNNQGRNLSSSSGSPPVVPTATQSKERPVSPSNNCINDEVYKKFGELTQDDLEMFPGTKTFETTVNTGPLPADFPSQLSPHPAMKLCWVSRASPEFGKDIVEGFNFISYSILFSVDTDLTEIADWYQKQFLSLGLNVSDDTEVSKSIHRYNADKFKQAGVNTFDLVKVITITLPSQAEAFPIKAGITFIRVNSIPGVQISYATISAKISR